MQKHPPRRDRSSRFYAALNVPPTPNVSFRWYKIGIHYDHVTKEAEMLVGDDYAIRFERELSRRAILTMAAHFHARLAELELELVEDGVDTQTGEWKYDLRQMKDRKLIFDSSLDVVLFINKVAAIFGYPPVTHLRETITYREVLVLLDGNKREWVDAGKWLASVALAVVIEKQLFEAFGKLGKEGDAIKLTLKSGDDVRGAVRISDSYGIAFLIPQPDRNGLREVCDKKKIPVNFVVTVEYRELITTGRTALARSLAPYVTNVALALA